MRTDLLMAAQDDFLYRYPLGFEDEELKDIKKKHNTPKHHEFAHTAFAKDKFGFSEPVVEDMIRLVQRASMVAVFEKPKFRDYVRAMSSDEKDALSMSLYELYHGDREKGFDQLIELFAQGKMARWTLITTFLYYWAPEEEVFIKPTTAKNMIKMLELDHLVYKPRPTYAFYEAFKAQVHEIKSMCDPRLGKDNAALTGMLWMTMPNGSKK